MADDRTREIAEQALDRLAAALDAGRSETLNEYLAAQARFYRYSWNNVLLIGSQRTDATCVAGFHTWHDLGRWVKRGEKGIQILAPVRVKDEGRQEPDRQASARETYRVAGFRTAYVFDVQQTDGRPLPAFAATDGDPNVHLDKLKAFVASQKIALEYDPAIAPAQGVSSGGRIRLVPGMAPAEEFSVLTHELAHEMLHHAKGEERLPKVVRETQAEAVAFVVSRGIGLDTNTAASDYIALYNGDKRTLAESLAVIQSASTRILNELLPEERSPSQANTKAARGDQQEPSPAGREGEGQTPPPRDRGEVPEQVAWDR